MENNSGWISVKDQLPAEDDLVVAAHIYDYGCQPDAAVCSFFNGVFHIYTDGIHAENYDGGATIQLDMQITHWHKLPDGRK